MNNIKIAIASIVLALSYIAFSHADAEVQSEAFDVRSGGTLYLDTDTGSITIESHDKATVEVVVKRRGLSEKDFDVQFAQSGDDIQVKGIKRGISFWSFGSKGAHFEVKVPLSYNIKAKTKGGSIALSDLNGNVYAKTSGGSLKLARIVGDVDIKTSGGSIKIDEVVGKLEGHTSGGSIRAKLSAQATEDSRLTTSGGSIRVDLLPSIAIDLEAKTSGGSVSSDFAVEGSVKRTKIVGKINGGGPVLYLKTSGGSVRVNKS